MPNVSARHVPQPEEVNAVVLEAIDRLAGAHLALRAFGFLLGQTEELGDKVNGYYLACLIAPHVAEVSTALEDLTNISVSPTH